MLTKLPRARTVAPCYAVVLVLAILSESGCNLGAEPVFNYTKKKPAEVDIVGSWVPTNSTLRGLSDAGYAMEGRRPVIVLEPDHKYRMTDMPDWWFGIGGQPHGQFREFREKSGKWELSLDGERGWAVTLDETASGWLYLRKQGPPYDMFLIVGDPDDWVSMTFQRH
jgi:hypothetical protein